jgi:valyl-tRNA synthetase
MPFITEELWQNIKSRLPQNWAETESIMVAAYPEADESAQDLESEQVMALVIEIIHSIRNARAEYRVKADRQIEARIYADKLKSAINAYSETIGALARARVVILDMRQERTFGDDVVLVLKEVEVVLPMESMFDLEVEKKRLGKEMEQIQDAVARLEIRLKNKAFLKKAPTAIIDREREKLVQRKDKLERLKEQFGRF